MHTQSTTASPPLYELDETAWLEQTASLIAQRRFEEIDHENLCEYLSDMARRDKREVRSRLVTLLTHLLKWDRQPKKRTNSLRGTILEQRRELRFVLESRTLRRHAGEILHKAYADAVKQAVAETGLAEQAFPEQLDLSVDQLLAESDSRTEDREASAHVAHVAHVRYDPA